MNGQPSIFYASNGFAYDLNPNHEYATYTFDQLERDKQYLSKDLPAFADNLAKAEATIIGSALGGAVGTIAQASGRYALSQSARSVLIRQSANAATKGEMTEMQLLTRAAQKAEAAIGGTGNVAGTLKHTYAKNLLSRYQNLSKRASALPRAFRPLFTVCSVSIVELRGNKSSSKSMASWHNLRHFFFSRPMSSTVFDPFSLRAYKSSKKP